MEKSGSIDDRFNNGTSVVLDILSGGVIIDDDLSFLENVEMVYCERFPGQPVITREDISFILQFKVPHDLIVN